MKFWDADMCWKSTLAEGRQKARVEMINIQRELTRGGVRGLFKKAGLLPRCQEWSRGFGANFRGAWDALPHPELLAYLAIALGVKAEEVVEASSGCVRIVMAGFGREPQPVACKILSTVEHAMADAVHAKYRPLIDAARDGGNWMRRARENVERPEDQLVVAAATNLAQAAMVITCPCGKLHGNDLSRAIEACLHMVTTARIVHAAAVGRIERNGSMKAKEDWSRKHTADAQRSKLPFEMVTAPERVSVPGVTPAGALVWSQRGQA